MSGYDKAVLRRAQFEDVLRRIGGTHTPEDVYAAINAGLMQSFSDGDTWVVTQIIQFPQKKICEIFMVVGTLAGSHKLKREIFEFAKKADCKLIRAFGRDGWTKEMREGDGWTAGARIFMREVG